MPTIESFLRRRLTRSRLVALALILCAGFTTFALGARAWIAGPAAGGMIAQSNKEKFEVELITLKRWGFEPKEITRPKGKVLFVINNRSEQLRQMTFVLADERKNRLKEVKLGHNGKKDWNGLFDLNPGSYLLSVVEQPDLVCRIIVTNK